MRNWLHGEGAAWTIKQANWSAPYEECGAGGGGGGGGGGVGSSSPLLMPRAA